MSTNNNFSKLYSGTPNAINTNLVVTGVLGYQAQFGGFGDFYLAYNGNISSENLGSYNDFKARFIVPEAGTIKKIVYNTTFGPPNQIILFINSTAFYYTLSQSGINKFYVSLSLQVGDAVSIGLDISNSSTATLYIE